MTTDHKTVLEIAAAIIPMPIITPRLIIRPVLPGDGQEVHEAVAETWDDLHRWMLWAKTAPEPVDATEENVRAAFAKFMLREDFRMVAIEKARGRMAVFTGIHRFDWEIRRMEIGYWTRKNLQGQGLATESTIALARYAFSALNARTVAICHADGNEASRRVIERIGFHYEGRLKNEGVLPDGRVVDKLWYSFTDISQVPALECSWGGGP